MTKNAIAATYAAEFARHYPGTKIDIQEARAKGGERGFYVVIENNKGPMMTEDDLLEAISCFRR